MKSKIILAVAFVCATMLHLQGQNQAFAPIGARWYYRPYEATYPDSKLYAFTVAKDTLLAGLPAREVACSQWIDGQFQDFPNLNKYVHANSDSVFYWVDNHWELLFDFGALPGDTILSKVEYFDIFNGCGGPASGQIWDFAYRIDSSAVENIGGWPLRVQYISSTCQNSSECWSIGGWAMPGKIVERIGAIEAGYWWGQGTNCILGGFPGYLRCYEDDLVHYAGSVGNTPCGYVNTNEIDGYNISISPNPTSGILYFYFSPLLSNLEFKVFDCLGRILQTGGLMVGDTFFQLNLESIPSGLLYVEFASKSQTKTHKIIKI